jgi:hypothetical protein
VLDVTEQLRIGDVARRTRLRETTLGAIRPYICTTDARAAVDWYVDAMGAAITYEPIVMEDNRIGQVELALTGPP